MNIKEALEKEIKYLNAEIRKSYEYSERQGDINIGKLWRLNTKYTIESYKRIIKSLTE
jgi:hypothetical protein